MATVKEWVHYILGGKCAHCGNKDHRCLQIDHIDPKTKSMRGQRQYGGPEEHKRWRGPQTAAKLIEQGRGGELQLLCANCHAIKTYEEKDYRPVAVEINHTLPLLEFIGTL